MAGSMQRWQQRIYLAVLLQLLLLAAAFAARPGGAHHTELGSPKMRSLLDPILEQSVAAGDIPGAVLLVGHNGRIIYRKAYGSPPPPTTHRARAPDPPHSLC